MGSTISDFADWATSSQRTDEEAFCAELLVEAGVQSWKMKHKDYSYWEHDFEFWKRRRLNPAHRTKLAAQDLERALEVLPKATHLRLGNMGDRPLRDLSGLRFFPQLRELDISQAEITDLTPLRNVPDLEVFNLGDSMAKDLRPVGTLTKLRRLWLHIWQPWPCMDGWNAFDQLEWFWWSGNLLAIEGLGPFPRVRQAKLEVFIHNLPARNATRLPAMPALDILEIKGLYDLAGIERWPSVRNLTLNGTFETLAPLAALPQLTHLTVANNNLLDLAALCRIPTLCWLKLKSVQPHDLFALTDAPRLHEVVVEDCDANARDLVALQEVLPAWDSEFLAPQPRPLAPMKFRLDTEETGKERGAFYTAAIERHQHNQAMQESESAWLARRLKPALDKALGDTGWGEVNDGIHWIEIHALEAAERLPVILEAARHVFAECRLPQIYIVHIDLKAKWDLDTHAWKKDRDEDKWERERADWEDYERRQREETELREREHRLRQLRQEGAKVNPAEFEAEAETIENAETDGPSFYPDREEPEDHPLHEQYDVHGSLTEDTFYVDKHFLPLAERLMGRNVGG